MSQNSGFRGNVHKVCFVALGKLILLPSFINFHHRTSLREIVAHQDIGIDGLPKAAAIKEFQHICYRKTTISESVLAKWHISIN